MVRSMRPLVMVPTYNECENIPPLLAEIFSAVGTSFPEFAVLVIDDNSPDGTADVVREIQKTKPYGSSVHLLSRPGKQGLGKAYLAGFAWGLEHGYDVIVEMDADFSHRPVDLIKILETMKAGTDFAVGSRYVSGGSTINWGLGRKIISRGGSLYSRTILGHPLSD